MGKRRYKSYLLRLWRAGSGGEPIWRVSLEDAHGGERVGFGSVDELCAFLRRQTGAVPEVYEDCERLASEKGGDHPGENDTVDKIIGV